MIKTQLFAFAMLTIGSVAQADLILNRADLNTQLGNAGVTEDFDSWLGLTATETSFLTLDSSTVVFGQGPGIVNPGLLFSGINSNRDVLHLQLDRRPNLGLTSGALLHSGGTLIADFTTPVTHFGLDLFEYNGFADSATIRVFASDNTTLLYSGVFAAPNAPNATFFGYTDSAGIGRVTLQSTTSLWSPLIDNLTYGPISAVPEPSSFTLLAISICLLASRRARSSRSI